MYFIGTEVSLNRRVTLNAVVRFITILMWTHTFRPVYSSPDLHVFER